MEYLRGNPRIIIRKNIEFHNNVFTNMPQRAVASVISPTESFLQALASGTPVTNMDAEFKLVLKNNQKNPRSVAEGKISMDANGRSDSAVHIYRPKNNANLSTIGEAIVKWGKDQNPPAALAYDLYLTYDPSFAHLPQPQIRQAMRKYIGFLKERLKHRALFAVQLDDGMGDQKEAVDSYNRIVLQELGEQGFYHLDPSTCDRYDYQREEDGTTGTLYVFTNKDYALGESDSSASTSVPLWIEEVAEVVNKGFDLPAPAVVDRS